MRSKRQLNSRVSLLITKTDEAMLEEIAEEEGLTTSDVIRHLVRKEYAAYKGTSDD